MFQSNKKIIIVFISAFLVFATGTTFAIILTNHKNKDEEKIVANSDFVEVDPISFYDTYFYNGVEIEDDFDIDFDNLKEEYVTGLIDKKVQKKINDKIIVAIRKVEEEIHVYENKGYEVNSPSIRFTANFSNVISININSYIYSNEDNNYEYYEINEVVNISLIDGKDIKFEELFTKEAVAIDVIRTVAYEYFAKKYGYNCDDFCRGDKNADLSKVEDDVFETINYYKQGNLKFYFDSVRMHIITPNMMASKGLVNFSDSIGIYTRFAYTTKELYEKPSKRSDLMPYTYFYQSNQNYSFRGFLDENDNILISYEFYCYEGISDCQKFSEPYTDNVMERALDKIKNKAGYFDFHASVEINERYNLVVMDVNEYLYISTPTYFKQNLLKQILYSFAEIHMGDYLEDNLNYTKTQNYYTLTIRDGVEINNLGQLFKSDYDYMGVIATKLNNTQYNGTKTKAELEALLSKYNFTITRDGIRLVRKNSTYEESVSIVYFEEFDSNMFIK